MEQKKQEVYIISFTFDEIKPLVMDNIDYAQDPKNSNSIARSKTYDALHQPLIEFYKKYKRTKEGNPMKPEMADKLAYIILLSYPKYIINTFNSMSNIKLFSNDEHMETDFYFREMIKTNNDEYDCICSYHRLKKIFVVQNKYSKIEIQVGSECITKYKLLSKQELQKFKEAEKEYNRKQREQLKQLEKQRKEWEEKLKYYRHCSKCEQLTVIKSAPINFICYTCYDKEKTKDIKPKCLLTFKK